MSGLASPCDRDPQLTRCRPSYVRDPDARTSEPRYYHSEDGRSLAPRVAGGIGHMARSKQQSFFKTHWDYRFSHGGKLRRSRHERKSRPLSTRDPHHIVFKVNRKAFRKGLRHPRTFSIVHQVIQQYSKRFFVKVEQFSVQHDHIHLLIRAPKRSSFQSFFRVVSGQIAQRVTDTFAEAWEGPQIWLVRPFSRVIKGYRAYTTAKRYIALNEEEVLGKRKYRPQRLKGLSIKELQSLWA